MTRAILSLSALLFACGPLGPIPVDPAPSAPTPTVPTTSAGEATGEGEDSTGTDGAGTTENPTTSPAGPAGATGTPGDVCPDCRTSTRCDVLDLACALLGVSPEDCVHTHADCTAGAPEEVVCAEFAEFADQPAKAAEVCACAYICPRQDSRSAQ